MRQGMLVANPKAKKKEPRDQLCILDSVHQFLSEQWNGATSRSNELSWSPKELNVICIPEMKTGSKGAIEL